MQFYQQGPEVHSRKCEEAKKQIFGSSACLASYLLDPAEYNHKRSG